VPPLLNVFFPPARARKSKNLAGSTPFHLAVQNTGRGGSGEKVAKMRNEQLSRFYGGWRKAELKDGKESLF
jgi:hypothetical protein